MNFPGIYKITNLINGKIYIGSSVSVRNRLLNHKNALRNNCHYNRYLQNSFNKYGEENFKFELIKKCSKNRLIYWEQYYIDKLTPEYNINKLAISCAGTKKPPRTKEHSLNIRKSLKNRIHPKRTKTWKRKIGKANSFRVINNSKLKIPGFSYNSKKLYIITILGKYKGCSKNIEQAFKIWLREMNKLKHKSKINIIKDAKIKIKHLLENFK